MIGFWRPGPLARLLFRMLLVVSASGSITSVGADPESMPGAHLAALCEASNVHCVDDTAGTNQEYRTIQAAVDAANPADVVVVFPGNYAGFAARRSGTSLHPVRVVASGEGVVISSGAVEGDGIRLQGVSHVVVEGFTIHRTEGSAGRITRCVAARGATANAPMRGNVVRGIRCIQPEAEGFYLSQFAEGLIENNVILGPGRNGRSRQHGIYLANAGSDDTVIRNNTISGVANNESEGIHLNGDLSVGGDGLITGLVIEGNRISSAGGNNALNMDGVQDSLIQNNLVAATGRHALRAYSIDGAAGPRRLKVVNNTFVALGGWAIKFSEDGGEHVIFNNILVGSVGSMATGAPIVSNANIFAGMLSGDSENTSITLSTWQSQSGQDSNSLVSTAAATFRDATGGDFRPASRSSARDSGLPRLGGITAPTADIDGKLRPAGRKIDIGAFES